MAKLELMDTTRTGKQAQELENKLRRLVVDRTKQSTRSSGHTRAT